MTTQEVFTSLTTLMYTHLRKTKILFISITLMLIENRQNGYVRIACTVSKTKELSLERISNVSNFNEVTNHWLNVATAHCIRKFGTLSEEDQKSSEEAKDSKIKLNIFSKEENMVDEVFVTYLDY